MISSFGYQTDNRKKFLLRCFWILRTRNIERKEGSYLSLFFRNKANATNKILRIKLFDFTFASPSPTVAATNKTLYSAGSRWRDRGQTWQSCVLDRKWLVRHDTTGRGWSDGRAGRVPDW